jgi:hypothetical protein
LQSITSGNDTRVLNSSINEIRLFSLYNLDQISGGTIIFSDENKLGEGGFGAA